MRVNSKIINECFFVFLLMGSTLPVSRTLPNCFAAPKVYASLFVCCLWGTLICSHRRLEISVGRCVHYILTVCLILIFIYVIQAVGWFPSIQEGQVVFFSTTTEFASCLSISLPIPLYLYLTSKSKTRFLYGITSFLWVATILHLHFRTGIICLIVIVGLLFKKRTNLIKIYGVCCCCIGFFLCLFLKSGSSSGRWFIIQRTTEMVFKHPFSGWGFGGFRANYMNLQASFFSQYPNSEYSMFAGNTLHPLNEFLLVAVENGLLVLVFVFVGIGAVVFYHKRHGSRWSKMGFSIFSCIIIVSFFSYPSYFPFTWVMLAFSLYLIFLQKSRNMKINPYTSIGLAVFSIVFGFMVYARFSSEKKWAAIMNEEILKHGKRQRAFYQLYPIMKYDTRFLYSFAYELYQSGAYQSALQIATECNEMLADYNLSLLQGDICFALSDYQKAIDHYTLANNMCPCRFAPLCAIYDVYKSMGHKEESRRLALEILKKPIKVESTETMDYIEYIKEELNK